MNKESNIQIANRQEQDWNILNNTAKEVLARLHNPFGSFEKSTYLIYRPNGEIFYDFTTTCRNTEECIKIMIEYRSQFNFLPRSFKIWKRVNGVQEIVYEYVYWRN